MSEQDAREIIAHDDAASLPQTIAKRSAGAPASGDGSSNDQPIFAPQIAFPSPAPVAYRCAYAWCSSGLMGLVGTRSIAPESKTRADL
jgi:hypothetical protein